MNDKKINFQFQIQTNKILLTQTSMYNENEIRKKNLCIYINLHNILSAAATKKTHKKQRRL